MGAPSPLHCPICGRETTAAPKNPYRPFCSNRCKLVDLDRWLSGSYRVPGPSVESSSMADEETGEMTRNNSFLTSDRGDEET